MALIEFLFFEFLNYKKLQIAWHDAAAYISKSGLGDWISNKFSASLSQMFFKFQFLSRKFFQISVLLVSTIRT